MLRRIPLALSLFLASIAAADSADLRVTVSAPNAIVQPGDTVSWSAIVENLGPDAAKNVRVIAYGGCADETLEAIPAGAGRNYSCTYTIPPDLHVAMLVAIAQSIDTPDPHPWNNAGWQEVIVDTPPDLIVRIGHLGFPDRGLPFTIPVLYRNLSRAPVDGAKLTVEVTGALGITKAPEGCTISGAIAVCDIVDFTADPRTFEHPFIETRFEALAPDANHAPITVRVSITSAEPDTNLTNNDDSESTKTNRMILVVNISDAGEGSLRAALDLANATCKIEDQCKIGFRIPLAGAAWATIRPETPLPALTWPLLIDGHSQTRFADTNPHGPEIEINGSLLASGNGLMLAAGCGFTSVRGLAINGFPEYGLHVAPPPCDDPVLRTMGYEMIYWNYIGTDPTGTRAVPNHRGVFIAPQNTFNPVHLTGNVISGNRLSGIWVARGTYVRIRDNRIGVNAALNGGLGNGASGVFIEPAASGTDLHDNYIGFNGHAGLSLAQATVQVDASRNAFLANGGLAIDHGLDGVSPIVPDRSLHPNDVLHAPVIVSARYDAATDTTTVEGSVLMDAQPRGNIVVTLYGNDVPDESGYGEGQYFLGEAMVEPNGRFTFVRSGRTPGAWIAGISRRHHFFHIYGRTPETNTMDASFYNASSEFSRTVEVSH